MFHLMCQLKLPPVNREYDVSPLIFLRYNQVLKSIAGSACSTYGVYFKAREVWNLSHSHNNVNEGSPATAILIRFQLTLCILLHIGLSCFQQSTNGKTNHCSKGLKTQKTTVVVRSWHSPLSGRMNECTSKLTTLLMNFLMLSPQHRILSRCATLFGTAGRLSGWTSQHYHEPWSSGKIC